MRNGITELLDIKYPIIQAGMIWCSGWELAAAVTNAGGMGVIGAGSMYPEVLRTHIQKCKAASKGTFAVNLPLLYPSIAEHLEVILSEQVQVVITSAGNPTLYTEKLKRAGIKVIHVIANKKFALKAEAAGVDAIVAEGFEAGGHNGREETTTLCLVPTIVDAVKVPVIAAGGIGSGRAMMAAMALGAQGIQVGTRFVACYESSAHQNFKDAVVAAHEGDTQLSLKQLTPVRLLKNEFWKMVADAESRGASVEELTTLLGRARAKKGMFEGDLAAGELEIGQVSASINGIATAAEIVNQIWDEFIATKNKISALSLD